MILGMAAEELVGTRIAKRRHQLELSQQELADRIGVSRDSVSKWERGYHYPHRHLGKLEEALGIRLSGENGGGPSIPTDPAERELWDQLGFLVNDEHRWRVIDVFREDQKRRKLAG